MDDQSAHQIGKLIGLVEVLQTEVHSLRKEVQDLNDLKNKGIGAVFVLVSLGSIFGWFANVFMSKGHI